MQAVQALLDLAPSTALLVTLDEHGTVMTEEETDARLIHPADLIKVTAMS